MKAGYVIYMLLVIIFTLPIVLAPQITMWDYPLGQTLQDAYGYTCHQYDSRSICFFPDNGSYENCVEGSTLVGNSGSPTVMKGARVGYKLPVCSRCIATYVAAFVGGIILLFQRKTGETMVPHPIYFLIALVPIAIDGGTQLVGLRESTNFIRFVTGFIAGFPVAFYCVPLLNKLFEKK